jgi:RimJ/RimL family protein N-acetyltransferase
VIISPKNPKEWNACAHFMGFYGHVSPSMDMKFIGWVSDEKLQICVGFHGFMGKACQIHIAMTPEWHFSPKEMLREVFNYAFRTAGRELLIGVVNSRNAAALRYDLHLGFKELYRIPDMHDDGGDIVIVGMKKEECRWLDKEEAEQLELALAH